MNATETLADLMAEAGHDGPLYDAPSGIPIGDDPRDYAVLAVLRAGGYVFAAVRGPSGGTDVYGPHPGALHRDEIGGSSQLADWVAESYPVRAGA